jgi:crotonobetainyl-CoA:carnitine CoA-transferase CaiB-like acyl-CoA transferase
VTAESAGDRRRPLDGLRVADFSWFGAGPIAAQTLAAFGAEVVRVESEQRVDGLRSAQPGALHPDGTPLTGYNVSGFFNNFNAGKLSLLLNMNAERGTELAYRLVAACDVFLTNYTPRVIERWRLGYDELAKVNPRVIAVYSAMHGYDGPQKDFLGFGAILNTICGLNELSGHPHRPPIGVGTNYPDYVVNPGHTVTAILAALRYRRRTGKGQRIEIVQLESAVNVVGTAVPHYLAGGVVTTRTGNRVPDAAPHGVFRCADDPGSIGSPDRWVAIACRSDAHWRTICETLGDSSAATDQRFATLSTRKANEDVLEALVSSWTAGRPAEQVAELLQARGVPAGVVQNAQDMLERDPHMRARGYYEYLEHPEAGRIAYDGPAARLAETPGSHRRGAPLLGEHTFEVCERILRLDAAEIADLVAEGVLA